MSQVNPDIQNLSNYFLQSSQQVWGYVDDAGNNIIP
jgi:hypothetical protein